MSSELKPEDVELSWKIKLPTAIVIFGGGAALMLNDYFENYARPDYGGQEVSVQDDVLVDPDLDISVTDMAEPGAAP